MKQIPEHLRKEIIRANKKRNRLHRKLFGGINEVTDYNFDHIEVKMSRDEFLNYDGSGFNYNEYAYFYKPDGKYSLCAEKIKNHKLKEYYENIVYFEVTFNPFAKKFYGKFDDCLNLLESNFTKEDIVSGFYLNDVYYSPQYYSITTKNEIESMYFYSTQSICLLDEFLGDIGTTILRINTKDFKISKIYFHPSQQKDLINIFYYYNRNEKQFSEVIVS